MPLFKNCKKCYWLCCSPTQTECTHFYWNYLITILPTCVRPYLDTRHEYSQTKNYILKNAFLNFVVFTYIDVTIGRKVCLFLGSIKIQIEANQSILFPLSEILCKNKSFNLRDLYKTHDRIFFAVLIQLPHLLYLFVIRLIIPEIFLYLVFNRDSNFPDNEQILKSFN